MARRRSERGEDGSQGPIDPVADQPDVATGADADTAADTASVEGPPQAGAEATSARRGRRGGVATETYAAVERLTGEEGLSRSEAFARLGAESDRRPATVAAAYYRAARQRGQGRGSRAPVVASRRTARSAGRVRAGDAERLLQAASAALGELAELVRRQGDELLKLRADEERYREIRALIEGSSPARRGRPRGS
jgi:hypothetical protein